MSDLAGRYRLLRKLGEGAMGVVWHAVDVRLDREVAVKQLRTTAPDPQARDRAFREARIAARLRHPHTVTLYDVVDDGSGPPLLVMEYVPSHSLAVELTAHGPLPPTRVARIGAQIASALAAAHTAGVIHRDVKPANILLDTDNTAKITDFGISRATGDITLTARNVLAGTPAYLSPEAARGEPPAPTSDVFSLAATLYTALEGTPPFGNNPNPTTQLHRVAAGGAPPPRHQGPLADVLIQALQDNPHARPTMATLATTLATLAAEEPATAHHATAGVNGHPDAGRHAAIPAGGEHFGTSSSPTVSATEEPLAGGRHAAPTSNEHPGADSGEPAPANHRGHGRHSAVPAAGTHPGTGSQHAHFGHLGADRDASVPTADTHPGIGSHATEHRSADSHASAPGGQLGTGQSGEGPTVPSFAAPSPSRAHLDAPPPTRLDLQPVSTADHPAPTADAPAPSRRTGFILLAVLAAALLILVPLTLLTPSDPTPDAQSPPPLTTTTTTAPPRTTPKPDAARLRQAVLDYYALLPDNPDQAWNRLTPDLQQNRDQYVNSWRDVKDLRVDSTQVSGTVVTVRISYTRESRGRIEETHRLGMLVTPDAVLINSDRLVDTRITRGDKKDGKKKRDDD